MDWFARPAWLLVLPLGAASIWLAERVRASVHPERAQLVAGRAARLVLRALVVVAAILAAAGARLPLKGEVPPCVLAVDVSRSMGGASSELASEVLESLPAGGVFAAVAFAGAREEARASRLLPPLGERGGPERVGDELELAASSLDRSSTDLASGIRAAAGLLAGARGGAIVLISDGVDTSASGLDGAIGAALECRAAGVPVFALAPARDLFDLRVEGVATAASVEAGRPVPLTAVLSSSASAEVLALATRRPGGEELGRARLRLSSGARTTVAFQDPSPPPGIVRYEVELRPLAEGESGPASGRAGELDDFPENDRAAAAVLVRGRPKVLVSPGGGSAAELLALVPERFEIVTARPEELPVSAEACSGLAAVVLDGLAREDVSPAAEKALADYVSLGGGLVVLGGPRAFGAGGWRDSDALSGLLPVKMVPGPSEKALVAFLIDASGSMAEGGSPGRSKIEDAREAVAAVLPMLSAEDEVALVGFRDSAEVLAEGVKAGRRDEILARLRTLHADGKTSLEAPLRAGLELLRARTAAVRTAVMLSDGEPTVETSRERLVALAREFVRQGLSLHTIGTGPSEAHRALLAELASEGGGAFEFATSFARLGEAMRRALVRAAGRFVLRGPVSAVPVAGAGTVLEGLEEIPHLGAANRTELRPLARAALAAGSGEPILSFAEAGSGRTAAFASSLGGGWAGELGHWPGRLRLLMQILREVSPPPPDPGISLRPARDASGLGVELAARDPRGAPRNLLELAVELRPASVRAERARVVRAEQVGLGLYRAAIPGPLAREPVLAARVLEGSPPRELLRAPVVLPPEPEVLRIGRDLAALDEIARASGGKLLSRPDESARALEGLRRVEWLDGSGFFALAALVLVVLEVALRALESARLRGPAAET